eukprot:CAMPEP_0172418170 /NCGR_PEP_ID=MMETSP1064-20121228/4688_1 /TAXON_ID=202472 /ORGANISM="Aulacoseira subarctica , Strain CCAP 1002/5" /LENGTH=1169 /DNA_ID=CAMNT_0013156975 /DNA_START=55 /DNA_END=3565 /DNA_ORIENTATION=+
MDFSKMEEEINETWKEKQVFKFQNDLSKERKDKVYTFYDGPPFATGLPHYGHILAGTIKDVVTRYACMNGYSVERRAGWDCHGLPVEYEMDQLLGVKHRQDVLDMGIDVYNAKCRSIVLRYTEEWRQTITRLGRWIDFDNDYKTMDKSYMESVWWVFSQLYAKGLVYQGYKVMPFSTACATPLSNFEAGLNYKQVKDPAIVVTFPSKGDPTKSYVAWTTTPWTLPSNVALCVHPELDYVTLQDKKTLQQYILAKDRICQLYPIMNNPKKYKAGMEKEWYDILDTCKGKDLVGDFYEPLFTYFVDEKQPQYFQVVADAYVTADSGTGIVHQAPAFGEDDYRVCCTTYKIVTPTNLPCPVDSNGLFTSHVQDWEGVYVKDADDSICQTLKTVGRLYQKDVLEHSYPYCWRSDTPLIYKAVPSWFVAVEQIRDKIVENNKLTYWVPSHVKEGEIPNWLTDARDWAVSRNRFWGTPLPIWTNEAFTEIICVGSVQQLYDLSGVWVEDLHREVVDHIQIPSVKTPGAFLKRVDEVFDCWFESGSMPYAQQHYPFTMDEATFHQGFPADFIAEGIDQTRGWFYTLMVLSTALFDKPAFKNLIVNGLVLAGDGQKMSKRKKNYPDPNLVISKYGADALRMYLINSPVVRAEDLKFQESGVLRVVKEVFLPLYNAFRFFLQNVERREATSGAKFAPDESKVKATTNPTDIWISAATQELIEFVHVEMEAYRLYTVMPALVRYVTQLTNWYVRLNRDRLKGAASQEGDEEKEAETGLQVLYNVLLNVTIIMAPFTPFITEYLYQHLRKLEPSYQEDPVANYGMTNPVMPGKSDSVHFLKLPACDKSRVNHKAVEAMEVLQTIIELGRNVREKRNISLKTPVKNVVVVLRNPAMHVVEGISGPLRSYVLSELNAWNFTVIPKENEHEWVTLSLLPNLTVLGKKLGKKMSTVKKVITSMTHEEAVAFMEKGEMVIEEVNLNFQTDIISKLSFSKASDDGQWEASQSAEGDVVVAVDCTQDEAIISAGRAREVVNHVQQLRKAAGLGLSDRVEIFFKEEEGIAAAESAISQNLMAIRTKLMGATPIPLRLAPSWSVVIGKEVVDVGGSQVELFICRPTISVRDDLDNNVTSFLATLDPYQYEDGCEIRCTIDDESFVLKEGVDFWKTAAFKALSTKSLQWV